jgi:hypothetical protein
METAASGGRLADSSGRDGHGRVTIGTQLNWQLRAVIQRQQPERADSVSDDRIDWNL